MKAYEIFRLLSSGEVAAIVLSACEDEEVPERIAGGVLTYQNLPLRRFAKLPEETRKSYVRRTLRDRRGSELSIYVLSAALVRRQKALVEAFLEATGLPHDGASVTVEGGIPEPPAATVNAAVDLLLARFPARDAAIYLHAFAGQPDVGWPALEARLSSDARLRLEDLSAI
jgi:hypothetical protein